MGKRKEPTIADDIEVIKPRSDRLARPNRHKKHKRRKTQESSDEIDSDASIDVSFDDEKPIFRSGRGKISKDSPPLAELQRSHSRKSQRSSTASPKTLPGNNNKKKKGLKGRESATSSEEERWLDAIESGKLEEVDDELKKIKLKDPKMMTARQRAMYERGNDKEPNSAAGPSGGGEALLALPSGYKQKVMTAEAIQKAAIKSQKRKQLADEKREKDKKKTMERLLKKQESKANKANAKSRPFAKAVPLISYRNTVDAVTISMPAEVDFPLVAQSPRDPPKPVVCGISTCANLKRYSCSQTGIPLCSVECYKKNLVNIIVS